MLSRAERRELRGIGQRDMTAAWRVAEIAHKVYRRNIETGSRLYDYQIYSAISSECGYSAGKVEQLVKLHILFPRETRKDYLLGHYTVAATFPDRFEVLEYIEFYRSEYGKLPAANRLAYLYRKQILGEYVDVTPLSVAGHELVPVECAESNPFEKPAYTPISALRGLAQNMRSLISSLRISKDGTDKLAHALELIEEVMPELLEVKQI